MQKEKVKIAIIKAYDIDDSYCDYCDRGSSSILQYGVENWIEIDRNDIYQYIDSVNKANSYRSRYKRNQEYKYILLEQSSNIIEFLYKDAEEFVKKQKEKEKKWEKQAKERAEKEKFAKLKREVTRTKKNLKKLNFTQEEINDKILETYGKEYV